MGFSGGARGEEPTCQCGKQKTRGFDPWVGKSPWRRAWQPTPVFFPEESHGQRRLAATVRSVCVLNHVRLFATPWTVACRALLSIEFSRHEYWNCLLFPTPGNLPNPKIKPTSPVFLALAGGFFTTVPPGKPSCGIITIVCT